MLYYDRIDAFEDIDVNKTSGYKKCIIFQYCYSYKSFRFQSSVLMMSFEYFKCLKCWLSLPYDWSQNTI